MSMLYAPSFGLRWAVLRSRLLSARNVRKISVVGKSPHMVFEAGASGAGSTVYMCRPREMYLRSSRKTHTHLRGEVVVRFCGASIGLMVKVAWRRDVFRRQQPFFFFSS